MKTLLTLLLACTFTGMQIQEPNRLAELQFKNFAELQLVFEDSYTITTYTCWRSDTVFEVYMSPNDSALAVPVTVLNSDGRLLVPFVGFETYKHFFVDGRFVFYETHDGTVGRYDFNGNHYVYNKYKELLDVRDGKILVRRNDNMVGLVSIWESTIVPFDYYHAWNGIQDDELILFSRSDTTWTHDTKGVLIRTGRL